MDPITKYNLEKEDLYYEGTTGDARFFKVKTLDINLNVSNLKLLSISDVTAFKDKNYFLRSSRLLKLKMTAGIESFVDFYAIYTKSNESINFHGLIHTNYESSRSEYNYLAELTNELGLVEFYCVAVSKNGTINQPALLANVLMTQKRIKVMQ